MGEVLRVVVADDQTVVRDGVCLMLGLATGIEVVGTAADGAEAVDVVTRTRPDVLLVDLRMPGLDGVQATRAVRAPRPTRSRRWKRRLRDRRPRAD